MVNYFALIYQKISKIISIQVISINSFHYTFKFLILFHENMDFFPHFTSILYLKYIKYALNLINVQIQTFFYLYLFVNYYSQEINLILIFIYRHHWFIFWFTIFYLFIEIFILLKVIRFLLLMFYILFLNLEYIYKESNPNDL